MSKPTAKSNQLIRHLLISLISAALHVSPAEAYVIIGF
jgi:hypothetical protein